MKPLRDKGSIISGVGQNMSNFFVEDLQRLNIVSNLFRVGNSARAEGKMTKGGIALALRTLCHFCGLPRRIIEPVNGFI